MKTFLLIFLCLTVSLHAKTRTPQQEAELKDWITGIQNLALDAETRADAAETEAKASRDQSAIASARLVQASNELTTLQKEYDAMQVAMDKAVAHDKKVTKLAETFATVIAVQLALITLLVCLKLGLPSVSPPWGLVATIALPGLAFGVIKLLPHVA